jgi:hypothetical protein
MYAGKGKNDLTRALISKLNLTGASVIYAAQILGRIKNEGVTVALAAKDHGVSEATLYN